MQQIIESFNTHQKNLNNILDQLFDIKNKSNFVFVVEYFYSSNTERQEEIDECIDKNIKSNLFNTIVIVYDTTPPPFNFGIYNNTKILYVDIKKRATYYDLFNLGNINSIPYEDLIIVANNDIVFDKTLLKLNYVNMSNKFFALLRYEYIDESKITFDKHVDCSQDTWIVQSPVPVSRDMDFSLGLLGCDNAIAYIFKDIGYEVWNPSIDIKTFHIHNSGHRTYTLRTRINKKYLKIKSCTLDNVQKLIQK